MARNSSKKSSQREDWHPADIIAALHKRGLTLVAIAKQHGLKDSSTLSKAMSYSYPAGEKRLADAAGVPVQEMFAARYYVDGKPIPRGIRGKRSLQCTSLDCQINGSNKTA